MVFLFEKSWRYMCTRVILKNSTFIYSYILNTSYGFLQYQKKK